jgi:hypothetical protein
MAAAATMQPPTTTLLNPPARDLRAKNVADEWSAVIQTNRVLHSPR